MAEKLKTPKKAAGQHPKPPEGSWTEHYPELGTEPVSYESSISPEFFELEREAVFKRAWLNVGRVEHLPARTGGYFTKELPGLKTSLIVVRGKDDRIRAFHNVCRHRGNKLVWTDHPAEEVTGTCRKFACKYHGWTYELDGELSFVLQEDEFFGLDKTKYGLVPVHCDVWKGFIFVNFADEPEWGLHEFLGPMITAIDYPFEKLTQRYYYRGDINSNWKIFHDAFQEFYHPPILHGHQNPVMRQADYQELGFYTSHFQIDGPHRVGSTTGGAGGITGGMGGMNGGIGGMTGGMGGMTGGMGGGGPVDAGDDSGDPIDEPGYVACTVETVATDCSAGAQCRVSDGPLLQPTVFVCSPACTTATDCPAAPAGGAGEVECTAGQCVITCSLDLFNMVACPTGMTCAEEAAVATCYDDGV